MSETPFRDFQFDENQYARPNQPWICGWASDGGACPLGPTKRGGCRSAFECAPYRQDDSWMCGRTRSCGGPCEDGPLPDGTCCRPIKRCQPVRSIMARRGIVSFCVFALALGVAFVMVGSPGRTSVVSPGPLNPQHSTVVQDCADCHMGGAGQLSDWIPAAFDSNAAKEQSTLCLKCHRDLREHALSPHNLAAADLAAITQRAQDRESQDADPLLIAVAKTAWGTPAGGDGTLACATCHREHHGKDFDLVNTTNRQCQICHAESFSSFSSGHPEFSQYPYERRSRLYFDHLSHYGSHFDENARSCGECHLPDVTGRYMLVRGFDQTCASCHQEQIEDDLDAGFALANIPGLDIETLRNNHDNGIDVGHWPDLYPLHVQAAGELTPLMKLLLQSDTGNTDLGDLRQATPAQLEQVQGFVWAYKEMLYDVVQGGQPAIQDRLTSVLAGQVSETEIAELVKLIPVELIANMQGRWLPDLMAEVEARRAGGQLPAAAESSSSEPRKLISEEQRRAKAVTSGWYLRDSDLSLRYRPAGHADPLLKLLIDVSARFAAPQDDSDLPGQAMRQVFVSLSTPFATGRCLKCHTFDSVAAGEARINWLGYEPSLTQHRFTEFRHSPHITLLDDEACKTCHEFRGDEKPLRSPFRAEFFQSDPNRFDSNFTAMTRSTCVNCHTPSAAGDRCLSCHNYHIHK